MDAVEGGDDALSHLFSLHHGGEELGVETEMVLVLLQLGTEIAVARRRGTGDDRYALGKERQPQLAVEVEHAFGFESGDDLTPFAGHVTDGIGGVDGGDNPREPVGLMKLGIDAEQQFHAHRGPLVGHLIEIGGHHRPGLAPAFGRCPGHGGIVPRSLLHQFHVAVALHLSYLHQFGLHPVVAVQLPFDGRSHQTVQFGKRQYGFFFYHIQDG